MALEIFVLPMDVHYVRWSMDKKELYQMLSDMGKLEYGEYITGVEFRELCGIESITTGTKEQFDSIALEELTYSGMIRDKLLNEGKYFKQTRDGYRVLLPSENQEQVMSYMKSADNKLKRAIKLDKNTPIGSKPNGNHQVRMIMKAESIKKRISK